MTAIMTTKGGSLAFHALHRETRPVAFRVRFPGPRQTSFAGLSVFPDNSNHAPARCEGAVTWDGGLDLLFRIAGAT